MTALLWFVVTISGLSAAVGLIVFAIGRSAARHRQTQLTRMQAEERRERNQMGELRGAFRYLSADDPALGDAMDEVPSYYFTTPDPSAPKSFYAAPILIYESRPGLKGAVELISLRSRFGELMYQINREAAVESVDFGSFESELRRFFANYVKLRDTTPEDQTKLVCGAWVRAFRTGRQEDLERAKRQLTSVTERLDRIISQRRHRERPSEGKGD